MPRLGGEADKFGNRYESLWVVDAALDLIEGAYINLVLEPIGDEAAGVEFFLSSPSGIREYHSVKRQQAGGNWTISRLTQGDPHTGRSILGDLVQKVQEGAVGVFSSGTSAFELEELRDEASASESVEEFQRRIDRNAQLSGNLYKYVSKGCADIEAAWCVLRCIRVRTENEPQLTRNVERRIRSMFRMETGGPTDATAVRLLVAEFTTHRLGAIVTADSFLSFLKSHNVSLARLTGDITVGQGLQQLNRAYLREVETLLINQVAIDRDESTAAYAALLGNGKSVMLEGTAGGGKSCILAQVVRQLDDQNIPALVVRLDRLTEDDQSAQMIGTRRGLPESPTITLGEFAGDQPSVLCIDQLDALSIVSARHQSAWGAFNELLDEAEGYPNMRVLFACRSFDLEQDGRLRALVADGNRVERIPVGKLDDDTIQATITASGVVLQTLRPEQLQLLSIPLHLYLFLDVVRSGEFDFTNEGDLFEAFWIHKARSVQDRLGNVASIWPRAIATLCDVMSERESLVAPEYVMDEFRDAVEVMASEAVVIVQDHYLRFFHESFFDYAFARTFLRQNSDLVQWLVSDEQHLFRRSQVRQVITLLRNRESDKSRYLQTLTGLLEHGRVRFHVKKLVLDWLRALPNPSEAEWIIVEGLGTEFEGHAWQVISNCAPWFDLLVDLGKWKSWLNGGEEDANRAMRLLAMPEVLNQRSSTVASLVGPLVGQSPEWRDRLRHLVERGYGYTSPEMEDLVIRLVADGTLDDARRGFAINSDWWSIWYMPSKERPEFTARVLGAWFDRQLMRAHQLELDDPFGWNPRLAAYSQFSEDVIKECASRAPLEFVQEMYPRFASFENTLPKEFIQAPNWSGEPDEQLREGLAEAMIALAKDNPLALDSITDAETLSPTKWMCSLVLRVWSSNPEFYAERIVDFLLEYPDQRLSIGYDMALGGADMFAAVGRSAVAAASPICSDESFVELEGAILSLAPGWEIERRRVGLTNLALLLALPEERVTDTTRRRIQELERRFPNAKEVGAPRPPAQDVVAQLARPPISRDSQELMTDDQWLSAMRKYTGERSSWQGGQFFGSNVELSQGLQTLVRKDPERFSVLVSRMDDTLSPSYFEAILSGLTSVEDGSGRPGTVDHVCSVLRRTRDIGVSISGTTVARSVGVLADEDLPSDILQMLCRVATDDPDPTEDRWTNSGHQRSLDIDAINSARGAAAHALSRLLFADRSLWDSLKPTIGQLVSDPVLSVRSSAVDCLLAVIDTNLSDALAYFDILATGADPILGSAGVERFIHYVIFRDYPSIKPLLLRMLKSAQSDVVQAGARQLAVAALWVDEARGDDGMVLEMGEHARAGAASVYAGNVAHETVGTECEERLRTLFTDESDSVRREASRCWIHMQPDQVATRGSLIGTFARSLRAGSDMSLLAYRLQDAQRPLPAEVCDLAEYAVSAFGNRAASIANQEAGAAYELSTLMVRMHEEAGNSMSRRRVLDTIDDMIRAGFYGIDEQLRNQYER